MVGLVLDRCCLHPLLGFFHQALYGLCDYLIMLFRSQRPSVLFDDSIPLGGIVELVAFDAEAFSFDEVALPLIQRPIFGQGHVLDLLAAPRHELVQGVWKAPPI